MRQALTVIALLTLPSAAALAQTDNAVEDLAPQREVTGHWWFDVSATGTSSVAGGAETSATAGTEAALALHAEEDGGMANSFLFSSLSLDGQARIAAGGQNPGAGASASVSSRVLQFRFMDKQGTVYELVPIDMWASVDHQAIPSLSSRRQLWRMPYSRQTLGGALSFGDVTGKGWDFLRVAMSTSKLEQTDETMAELRHREHSFDATFVMYDRARPDDQPAFHADIVTFGATGILADGAPDAAVGFVDLLRVHGVSLYRGQVFADAEFGFAGTATMNLSGSSGGDQWSTTINTENLPNTGTWTGNARVYGFLGRELSAGLEFDKDAYLTVDVELAIESRLSAFAEWRNRHGALQLRAFASDNLLWLDKMNAEATTTGGVFASWHQPLGHDLSLITSLEVARSFYASLDAADGIRPGVATGANVFVTLARHFGTDWRERRLLGL